MKWGEVRWRRLYIREEGSFALLPLYVRALAGELLKFTDDDGRIFVGEREPWEVIARLAGAEIGERRMLRQHIPLLLKDGYLVRDGAYIIVKNQVVAQGRDKRQAGTSHARTENESSMSGERVVNEHGTSGERTQNESCTNSELSTRNDSGLGLVRAPASERSEEIREDKIRERDPAKAGFEPSGSDEHLVKPPEVQAKQTATDATSPPLPTPVGQQPLLVLSGASTAKPRAADDIFAAYLDGWRKNNGHGRAPVLDEKRKRAIAVRLKDFDAEQLKAAARGIWASAWHLAEGQTSFDLAIRDAAHIERFALLDPSTIPKRGEGPIFEEDDLSDAPPMRPSVLACTRSSGKTLDELIASFGKPTVTLETGTE